MELVDPLATETMSSSAIEPVSILPVSACMGSVKNVKSVKDKMVSGCYEM